MTDSSAHAGGRAVAAREDAVDVPGAPPIPGLRYRRYAGPADLPGIVDVLHAGRRADGVEWLPSLEDVRDDFAHLVNEYPERDMIVVELEGRPVGYARAGWALRDGSYVYHTTCAVHPDVRRRGIGRALLHAQQARLREIRRKEGHPPEPPPRFVSEILDGEDGAKALLDAEGYSAVRWFAEMLRPLANPIPEMPLPPGLEIRPVEESDYRKIFDAEAEAFRDHWGSREWTDVDFRRTFESNNLETSLWRVVWDGDEVVAVTETFIHAEENQALGTEHGWLERISTRRQWRGRGVAKAMIVSAMRALHERGMTHAALGVDTDNPSGAMGLYEGLGFRIAARMEAVARPFD